MPIQSIDTTSDFMLFLYIWLILRPLNRLTLLVRARPHNRRLHKRRWKKILIGYQCASEFAYDICSEISFTFVLCKTYHHHISLMLFRFKFHFISFPSQALAISSNFVNLNNYSNMK